MMKRLFSVLVSLLLSMECLAQDTSTDVAAYGRLGFVCEQAVTALDNVYAEKIYDISGSCGDPVLRKNGMATYAIWLLSSGKNAEASALMRKLQKVYSASEYDAIFGMTQYQTPCAACAGSGQTVVSCSRCKGDVKCKACKGSGQIELLNGKEKCRFCKGTGKCPACNGTGKQAVKCGKCAGAGGVLSKDALIGAFADMARKLGEEARAKERLGRGYIKVGTKWMTPEEVKSQDEEKQRGMAALSRDDEEKDLFAQAIFKARTAATYEDGIRVLTEAIDKRPGSSYASGAIMMRNELKQKRAEEIRSRND